MTPVQLGKSINDLAKWTEGELKQVSRSSQELLKHTVQYKAPPKQQTGTVVYADGTHWNPGQGEGSYVQTSTGAWQPQFAAAGTLTDAPSDGNTYGRKNGAWATAAPNTVMGASGTSHAQGLAPDPGSTAGTTRFLREDATWAAPPVPPTAVPPVPATFKNLSIKVATTTTVAVAADYVAVTDGSGNFQMLPFSGTINFAVNGANGLDTGAVAIDTWYSIWCIAQPGGTTALLASTSTTAPTMPSGYTQKARVGWVKTIHAAATLFGTWQFGNRARYVVGLAGTTTAQRMSAAIAGNPATPTWVAIPVNNGNVQASYVPPTASMFEGFLSVNQGGTTTAMAAPNSSYGAATSTTNPPPVYFAQFTGNADAQVPFSFLLESNSIYWANNTAGNAIYCTGWEDNI